MENLANCQSLDALAKVWEAAVQDIAKMPEDQAKEIIELKDYRKAQLTNSTQIIRQVKSKVLGQTAKMVLDPNTPDEVVFDGARYSVDEINKLKTLDRENLIAAHNYTTGIHQPASRHGQETRIFI